MIKSMLFFVVHILVSIVYFLYWYRKNKEESIYRLIVVFLIPIAGILYLTITDIFGKDGVKEGLSLGTLHGIEKDIKGTGYLRVDFQKEINVIPVEEALLLNTGDIKRKLIVDTLKDDVESYIGFISKALSDEDTETSHYAAATIMEVKRRLAVSLQDLAVRYERDRSDIKTAKLYADILKRYIDSGFLDNRSTIKYKYIYSSVLKNILSLDTSEEQYFVDKINCDIDLHEYTQANDYCHLFHKFHAHKEASYTMHMKLFYTLRDYNKFSKTLMLLKKSDIRFSNKTLNTVRFWSEVSK